MALIDIWNLNLHARFGTQDVLNVFQFHRVAASISAQTLMNGFEDTMMNALVAMQSTSIVYERMEVFNLSDPTLFGSRDMSSWNGTVVGEVLPAFNAFSFVAFRKRRDMRNGYKRFAGVNESSVTNGSVAVPFQPVVQTVADNLAQGLIQATDPGVIVARWCIVQRVKVVDPVTGKVTYRLPESDAELQEYQVDSVAYKDFITSQVSRRVYNA